MEYFSWLIYLNDYSELILAGVTFLYLILIYLTFRLTRKDVEVRTRPYLDIERKTVLPHPEGDRQIFKIHNSGKTPAKLIYHESEFLECRDPGEKFLKSGKPQRLNQRSIIPPNHTREFHVDVGHTKEKIGLELTVVYQGTVFERLYKTKVLFKLEGNVINPIDSMVT